MKTVIILKIFFYFFIFSILFLLQAGFIYILMNPSISIIIDSFLASMLITCFSLGFIIISLGFNGKIESNKNLIMRYLGIILIMVSFASLMLVMIEL